MMRHGLGALLGALAVTCITGCGAKLGESKVSDRSEGLGIADSDYTQDFAYVKLARKRHLPEHAWRPPRLVDEGAAASPPVALIPKMRLLHVEVTTYPPIACEGPRGGAKARDPRLESAERAPAIMAEELARLGTPLATTRVWIMAAGLSQPARWEIGGEWVAGFLRELAPGQAMFFPPFQNCDSPRDAAPDRVPRAVFNIAGDLWLGPRTPFTARLLEVCPASTSLRAEVIRSRHIPLKRFSFGPDIGFSDDRTLHTARVKAKCRHGESEVSFGPFASDSAAEHPQPDATLRSTLPP